MSVFKKADGFGNLSNGTHTAGATVEIIGEQWSSYAASFSISDIGDGRKWLTNNGAPTAITLLGSVPNMTTLALCFRVYPTTFVKHVQLFALYHSTDLVGTIGINTSGQVVYTIDEQGRLQYSYKAVSSPLSLNTPTFVEVLLVLHNSTGAATIYLNGVEDVAVSSQDTIYAGSLCNVLKVVPTGAGTGYDHAGGLPNGWKLTDIILHTGAGSPIGDAGVYDRAADADGADSDFTPSAGANYECVDEIGPDGDTTYNESDGTAGHRDSFETPGVSGMEVLSVGVRVRARKTDSGSATLLLGAIHSGSEDQSSGKALGDDYSTLVEFFDTCPSTAAAWTPAQVTAAELSYEVGA